MRAITTLAIEVAREAGEIALAGFRSPDLSAALKRDIHDVVTRYDRECEEHIRARILERFPDASIVGEEAPDVDGGGSLTWIIDPIDGTSNYARGIALWAVSVAVAVDGEIVCGVIFDAANGQLFWADERGAFLVDDQHGTEAPLRSRGSAEAPRATVALNFPLARDLVHFPELALEQFASVTQSFAQVRGLGSTCIALAWIAAGWLDATISFETHPWDIAAGAYLIRRAGGVFACYENGEILPESRDYLGPHYYAAVQGAEFELLREIMRTQSRRPLSD